MTQVLSASCQELAGSSLPVTQLGLQYGSYKVVWVTLPSHCSLYFSSMPFLDPQFPSPAPPLFPYPPFSSPYLLFPAPSAPSPPPGDPLCAGVQPGAHRRGGRHQRSRSGGGQAGRCGWAGRV